MCGFIALNLITNVGHSIQREDNGDRLDGNQDHRVDDASYGPGCPSCNPWDRVRNQVHRHGGCKLKQKRKLRKTLV